jgi:hypothetical protein
MECSSWPVRRTWTSSSAPRTSTRCPSAGPHEPLHGVHDAERLRARLRRRHLTDCVAATSQEEHDNAIAYDYPMFSCPMNSEEFLDELGGGAPREDTSRRYRGLGLRSGPASVALSTEVGARLRITLRSEPC